MTPKSSADSLLTTEETAQRLHLCVGTLAIWRCRKRYGLAYIKVGSKVFYRASDVEGFLQKRTRKGE